MSTKERVLLTAGPLAWMIGYQGTMLFFWTKDRCNEAIGRRR